MLITCPRFQINLSLSDARLISHSPLCKWACNSMQQYQTKKLPRITSHMPHDISSATCKPKRGISAYQQQMHRAQQGPATTHSTTPCRIRLVCMVDSGCVNFPLSNSPCGVSSAETGLCRGIVACLPCYSTGLTQCPDHLRSLFGGSEFALAKELGQIMTGGGRRI